VDVRNRTLLDVGCDSGAFCLDALRMGASRVLGIDGDPDRIRLARSYASLAELPARFETMEPEEDLPEGRYDVVHCSKLSEFVNPAAMIARLAQLTEEQLMVEFDGPRSPDAASVLQRIGAPRGRVRASDWPQVVVAELRGRGARSFLSPSAVEALLLRRSARFSSVEIVPLGAGRYRAIATRRVVSRLIVVAAAGRVETERLVNKIRTGDAPAELLERLDLSSMSRWSFAPNGVLASSSDRITPGIVYGYDLHAARRRNGDRVVRDDLIDLLESAAEVVVVTAWTDPEELRQRGRQRVGRAARNLQRLERQPVRVLAGTTGSLMKSVVRAFPKRWTLRRLPRFIGRARTQLNLEARIKQVRDRVVSTQRDDRAYRQTEQHLVRYARWMDFCEHVDADEHWVVDNTTADWTVHEASGWGHLLVERAKRNARI